MLIRVESDEVIDVGADNEHALLRTLEEHAWLAVTLLEALLFEVVLEEHVPVPAGILAAVEGLLN